MEKGEFMRKLGLQHINTANAHKRKPSLRIKYLKKKSDIEACRKSVGRRWIDQHNRKKNGSITKGAEIYSACNEDHSVKDGIPEKECNRKSKSNLEFTAPPLNLKTTNPRTPEETNQQQQITMSLPQDKMNSHFMDTFISFHDDEKNNISVHSVNNSAIDLSSNINEKSYEDRKENNATDNDSDSDEPRLIIDESYESTKESSDNDEIIYLGSVVKTSEKQIKQNHNIGHYKSPAPPIKFIQASHETSTNIYNFTPEQERRMIRRVFLKSMDLTGEKGKALCYWDRAKRLEGAIYSQNIAVEYPNPCKWPIRDRYNPIDFPCIPTLVLVRIMYFPEPYFTQLLIHHDTCPGFGCEFCHPFREALFHILIHTHRCRVWLMLMLIMGRHARNCSIGLRCTLQFCFFTKHQLHLDGESILENQIQSQHKLLEAEFKKCEARGYHKRPILCNHSQEWNIPKTNASNIIRLVIDILHYSTCFSR